MPLSMFGIADNAQNDVTDNEENDRIGYVDEIKPGTSAVNATTHLFLLCALLSVVSKP